MTILIDSFRVNNFKSIRDSNNIYLPKLTIIIGPNSSGKSSLFQPLLLMKQTFEVNDPNSVLVLDGNYGNFGEFEDFIYQDINEDKPKSKDFSIQFNFANIDSKSVNETSSIKLKYCTISNIIILKEIQFFYPPAKNSLKLFTIKIGQQQDKKHQEWIKIEALNQDKNIIFLKKIKKPIQPELLNCKSLIKVVLAYLINYYPIFPYYDFLNLTKRNSVSKRNEEIDYKFEENFISIDENEVSKINYNVAPDLTIIEPKNKHNISDLRWPEIITYFNTFEKRNALALKVILAIYEMISDLDESIAWIEDFLNKIHHIGPVRSFPKRVYFSSSGKPTSIGKYGKYAPEILWINSNQDRNLVDILNNYLFKLGFEIEVNVMPIYRGIYQLRVKQNNITVNLADVGFGLSQVLPVLVECINFNQEKRKTSASSSQRMSLPEKEHSRLVICQQPEIHLNPKIQSDLADFFISLSEKMSFIIETHSEHILTRVQRRIAEGTLDPKDVAVYFVSKNGNASNIKRMIINESGEFDFWPENFFQEDFIDSVEILRASNKRKKAEDAE